MTLNISKLKQQISNLQNQIAQQQAAYVNKQPGGNHTVSHHSNIQIIENKNPEYRMRRKQLFELQQNMGGNGNVGIGAGIGIANIGSNAGVGPSANDYLRNQHDPINSLQGSFSEMSMAKVILDIQEFN